MPVYIFMYVRECTHMYMCMWRPKVQWQVVPSVALHHCFWVRVFSLNLEVPYGLDCLASELLGAPVSSTPPSILRAGITDAKDYIQFSTRVLRLHAYAASDLPH